MALNHIQKFLWAFLLFTYGLWSFDQQQSYKVHAAIDLGTGGPKLLVAEVDPINNKINKILYSQRYLVDFYDSVSHSEEHLLSDEVISRCLDAFEEAVGAAKVFGAERIVAIATASLRLAANGQQLAEEILLKTGIPVYIVNQSLEGMLTFRAALTMTHQEERDLIVWDIGGGSSQFIGLDVDGVYNVYQQREGSGAFKDWIIRDIQKRSVDEYMSPNPLSSQDIASAIQLARELASSIDDFFKDKINNNPYAKVVGAGSVFGLSLAETLDKQSFTLEELEEVVWSLADKTDADLGGNFFDCVTVSNAILVLGFMQELGIKQMDIVNVNNAHGALFYGQSE